jgi:hypothetical protein
MTNHLSLSIECIFMTNQQCILGHMSIHISRHMSNHVSPHMSPHMSRYMSHHMCHVTSYFMACKCNVLYSSPSTTVCSRGCLAVWLTVQQSLCHSGTSVIERTIKQGHPVCPQMRHFYSPNTNCLDINGNHSTSTQHKHMYVGKVPSPQWKTNKPT